MFSRTKGETKDALAKRLVNIVKDVCLVLVLAGIVGIVALVWHGYYAVQISMNNLTFVPILN